MRRTIIRSFSWCVPWLLELLLIAIRRCPLTVWWLLSLAGLLGWCAVWIIDRHGPASFLLLMSVLAAGGAGHHGYWRLYRADEIGRMVREGSGPVCVEAIAITSPRWVPAPPPTALRTIPQGEKSELVVWVTAIRDGQTMRSASGWADLDVGGLLEHVRAGDRLRIMAQGGRPLEPLNPGEFDFANYQTVATRRLPAVCRVSRERRAAEARQPVVAAAMAGRCPQRRVGNSTPLHRTRAGDAGLGGAAWGARAARSAPERRLSGTGPLEPHKP